MKGLLIKDYYEIRKILGIYLVMCVIVGIGSANGMLLVISLYGITTPASLISIDERTRFDRLLMTMPVSGVKTVLDKYIYAWTICLLAVALYIIRRLLPWFSGDILPAWLMCIVVAGVLFVQAVMLPCIYHLGSERGRLTFILVIGAASGGLATLMNGGTGLLAVSLQAIGPALLVIAAVLNIGSVFLSARLFGRRLTA